MSERRLWSEDELRLALYLYFQLPFGKLHSRQPDIVRLSSVIGRTPSSVAMKLVNFASLDPQIAQSGRSGLGNASALDREVWRMFNADWDASIEQAQQEFGELTISKQPPNRLREEPAAYAPPPSSIQTTREAMVELRVGQQFFRNAVLANFGDTCCITGLAERRVLVASHIRPWSLDRHNRLNPTNGLCLSSTMDRAFDAGLLSITPAFTCAISNTLKRHPDTITAAFFGAFEGRAINRPQKISVSAEALEWHRSEVFREDQDAVDLVL